ncbi:MAG: hypothetical protein WCL32_23570, partial [Planctomycetota bacterium]
CTAGAGLGWATAIVGRLSAIKTRTSIRMTEPRREPGVKFGHGRQSEAAAFQSALDDLKAWRLSRTSTAFLERGGNQSDGLDWKCRKSARQFT